MLRRSVEIDKYSNRKGYFIGRFCSEGLVSLKLALKERRRRGALLCHSVLNEMMRGER